MGGGGGGRFEEGLLGARGRNRGFTVHYTLDFESAKIEKFLIFGGEISVFNNFEAHIQGGRNNVTCRYLFKHKYDA